jgi:hypothetical protein
MKTGSSHLGVSCPPGRRKRDHRKFNIGYAPPYSDEQYRGRALIDGFLPRFEKDAEAFNAFSDGGLVRFLNDAAVKGYGYYCRQIDFNGKIRFQEITVIFRRTDGVSHL